MVGRIVTGAILKSLVLDGLLGFLVYQTDKKMRKNKLEKQ